MRVASLPVPRAALSVQSLAVPVAIAVASRMVSEILLLAQAEPSRSLPHLVANTSPFAAWDGQWYIHIASSGYHALAIQGDAVLGHHDYAFFPGWPLLIRIVSLNGVLAIDATAVVLAHLLFVVAAVTVYQLFVVRFNERAALWATALLCFNPVAYVFSMAYSEGLFVLLVALYFLDRYGRASPALAALSSVARLSGLAIGASAAAMLVLDRAPRVRLLLICGAVGAVFAGWWVFIWRLTGSFTGWFKGSPSWTAHDGPAGIPYTYDWHPTWELMWMAFVVLMIVGSLLLIRRHPDLAIFSLVAIAMSLLGAPPSSMPRHAMVAFPAFGAVADRLGTRLSAAMLVVFVIAQYLFVGVSFAGRQAP